MGCSHSTTAKDPGEEMESKAKEEKSTTKEENTTAQEVKTEEPKDEHIAKEQDNSKGQKPMAKETEETGKDGEEEEEEEEGV